MDCCEEHGSRATKGLQQVAVANLSPLVTSGQLPLQRISAVTTRSDY